MSLFNSITNYPLRLLSQPLGFLLNRQNGVHHNVWCRLALLLAVLHTWLSFLGFPNLWLIPESSYPRVSAFFQGFMWVRSELLCSSLKWDLSCYSHAENNNNNNEMKILQLAEKNRGSLCFVKTLTRNRETRKDLTMSAHPFQGLQADRALDTSKLDIFGY